MAIPISWIFDSCENPKAIGEAVEEESDGFRDGFPGFVQGEDGALGAAGHGTGEVQSGASQRTLGAGSGPVGEADPAGFVLPGGFDQPFEVGEGQCLVRLLRIARGVLWQAGEFAHESEEALLQGVDEADERGVAGRGAGQTEGRIEFVHSTEGFNAKRCFGDAPVE